MQLAETLTGSNVQRRHWDLMTLPLRFSITTHLRSQHWRQLFNHWWEIISSLIGNFSPRALQFTYATHELQNWYCRTMPRSRVSCRQHFNVSTPRLIFTAFEVVLSCTSEKIIKPCKSSPGKDYERLEKITFRCCKRCTVMLNMKK